MKDMPWVRLWPTDWLATTMRMNPSECGIYTHLFLLMLEEEKPLREDHTRLARRCNSPKKAFSKAVETLIDDGAIVRTDEGLWSEKVEAEIDFRAEKSQSGKTNAKKRWQKNQQNQRKADTTAMRPQCYAEADTDTKAESWRPPEGGAKRKTQPLSFNADSEARGLGDHASVGESSRPSPAPPEPIDSTDTPPPLPVPPASLQDTAMAEYQTMLDSEYDDAPNDGIDPEDIAELATIFPEDEDSEDATP